MLSFTVLESAPNLIVTLKGRFDASGAMCFEEEFKKLNCLYPILDFSNVSYLSSAGIRVLLQTEKLLRSKNGKLIFSGLSFGIKQVLSITGLYDEFTQADNLEKANEIACKLMQSLDDKFQHSMRGHNYTVKKLPENKSRIHLWDVSSTDKNNFTPVCLNEFNLALGTGGVGIKRSEALESKSKLLISKKFLGLLSEKDSTPDYLFSQDPGKTFFYLSSGFNISGSPSLFIELNDENPILLKELINDAFSIISDNFSKAVSFAGLVITGTSCINGNEEGIYSVAIAVDKLGGSQDQEALKIFHACEASEADNNLFFYSLAATLKSLDGLSLGEDVYDNMNSVLSADNIHDVIKPGINLPLNSARVWIFIPGEFINAETERLQIEFESAFSLSDEHEIITRKIYSDCSRIILKQLHGGYSASTFQVFGYDNNGARILPTVLKLGRRAGIDREVKRYNEFVRRFILNNSTSIMGDYSHGESGGVRYNFVGITGPDSRIKWLTHYYTEKSAEELIPLFDRIFTDILRPWYGQPRLETFFPYKEHDPTKVLFTELFKSCEAELGISADDETIYSEELGRKLINPYWFLKHGYKKRENQSKLWYKCICHGDLNMQNILLDEIDNVYVIDFSETNMRNAVSDFARLEPIFKFEFTKLDSFEELKSLLVFEEGLLKTNRLDQAPEFIYTGNDPAVDKAYKLICRLRHYADTVTIFETDIIPYLVAVLEWTFSVVCYQQLGKFKKRYSALSAALICEKILELEKGSK